MAPSFTINCLNQFIKGFVISFLLYCLVFTYIYNTGVIESRKPFKKPSPFVKKMKFILQWSGSKVSPFPAMGKGNSAFIANKCKHTNCFVTATASRKLTEFNAIAFNGREVIYMKPSQLPKIRSTKQKYIFAATESADRFPACNKVLDNFFNWTWTYKISSTFRFGYITIYDLKSNVVGPAIDMTWPEYMKPISEDLKKKLSSKSKAAAWFVSHCHTINKREDLVHKINKELNQFGWEVDIYGSCSKLKCPKSGWRECAKKVEKEYFFYFAFENSFAEDYVTEKILRALNNYAVPVVFGSANYSRFLPPGSYLNAKELDPSKLARIMNELIREKEKYYDFFRWRNHFVYKETTSNADICKLCEVLNDDKMVNTVSVWKNFRKWWNTQRYASKCT